MATPLFDSLNIHADVQVPDEYRSQPLVLKCTSRRDPILDYYAAELGRMYAEQIDCAMQEPS